MTVDELRKALEGVPGDAIVAIEMGEYLGTPTSVSVGTGKLERAGYTDTIEESDDVLVTIT